MPKAKSSSVKKRRVIIATMIKKDNDIGINTILNTLRKEYGIVTTRQTVTTDKTYLSKQDLDKYIRSESDLLLEVDRDMINAEIELNKTLRGETSDLNIKAKFSSILRRLGVDRTNVDEKIDALRMKKLEIEKPVYIITIGTQKEVDVALYKKRDKDV